MIFYYKSYRLVLSICILISFSYCKTPAKLYKTHNKFIVGTLSNTGYEDIKNFLKTIAKQNLNDTIIIKYEYNKETCWDELDKKDNEYINSIIVSKQQKIQAALLNRKQLSCFTFREDGKRFNKVIKWDNSIIVDANHTLFNLLFYDKATCGSSIIIMPDKRYLYTRTDSHFDALNYTKEKTASLLSNN